MLINISLIIGYMNIRTKIPEGPSMLNFFFCEMSIHVQESSPNLAWVEQSKKTCLQKISPFKHKPFLRYGLFKIVRISEFCGYACAILTS